MKPMLLFGEGTAGAKKTPPSRGSNSAQKVVKKQFRRRTKTETKTPLRLVVTVGDES